MADMHRCISVIIAGLPLAAAIELAPPFRDGAVLQHGQPIPVWGYAAAGAAVTVQLAGETRATIAATDGYWRVTLPAQAPGPTGLTLSASATGEATTTVTDVAIGEVWVLSGQSNMQWSFESTRDRKGRLRVDAPGDLPRVRLFMISDAVSGAPCRTVPASDQWPAPSGTAADRWRAATATHLLPTSMTGYHMAAQRTTEVSWPIGLLQVARGGTSIETWMNYPSIDRALDNAPGTPPAAVRFPTPAEGGGTKDKTYRWNGTIHPIAGYAISGVVWYQGEDNARNGETAVLYDRLLGEMRFLWRNTWQQGELPFIVVQLHANSNYGRFWPEVRDGQRRAVLADARSRLVPTADILRLLHPGERRALGQRLAIAARSLIDGDGPGQAPIPRQATRSAGSGTVSIAVSGSGTLTFAPPVLPGTPPVFQLRQGGVWREATATLSGGTLLVSAPDTATPDAVRYGWQDEPRLTVFTTDGLPMSPCALDVTIAGAAPTRSIAVDILGATGVSAEVGGTTRVLPASYTDRDPTASTVIHFVSGGNG
jgi:sialate O-acetylesterase